MRTTFVSLACLFGVCRARRQQARIEQLSVASDLELKHLALEILDASSEDAFARSMKRDRAALAEVAEAPNPPQTETSRSVDDLKTLILSLSPTRLSLASAQPTKNVLHRLAEVISTDEKEESAENDVVRLIEEGRTYEDWVDIVRATKKAMTVGLPAEGGHISEETRKTLSAMALFNPTYPNPAADDDLWSGRFQILSLGNALLDSFKKVGAVPIADSCEVQIADNTFTLEADLLWQEKVVGFRVSGTVGPKLKDKRADDQEDILSIEVQEPSFSGPDGAASDATVEECAVALRPLLPIGSFDLKLHYLDQDFIILGDGEDAKEGDVAVLSKIKT